MASTPNIVPVETSGGSIIYVQLAGDPGARHADPDLSLIRALADTIASHAASIADGTSTNELGAASLIRSNAETLHTWIAAKVQP